MAFDKTYIINRMLLKVNGESISNPGTLDSKNSRLAELIYDGIVYETFSRDTNWHFATTRAQLVEMNTTPAFGWDHQFAYPQGSIRIIKTVDENCREVSYPYKKEVVLTVKNNRKIETEVMLCNQEEVFVQYVYLRTDPASWPGWFQKLVILAGAKELVGPIKKDDFTALNIKNDLALALSEAKAANGSENMKTNQIGRDIDRGNQDFANAQQDYQPYGLY